REILKIADTYVECDIKDTFTSITETEVDITCVELPIQISVARRSKEKKMLELLIQTGQYKHVRMFGAKNGYGISIARSKPNTVYLTCDQRGSYQNRLDYTDETCLRKTSSRLKECLFALRAQKGFNNLWTFTISDSEHNHKPSKDPSAHPTLRRLDNQALEQVKTMTKAGTRSRQILALLNQNNPTALLDELKKGLFQYDYMYDSEEQIFFLQQAKAQNEILRMIQEPAMQLLKLTIAHTRGRPTGSKNNINSTRRILSVFELQDLKIAEHEIDLMICKISTM
ncbi:1540_t:CDS:2, partial [Racocetra persica]